MTRARHAAYNPRKLVITILMIVIAVLLLAVIASRSTSRGEATAEPVVTSTSATPIPQPTWTSYVPTTPQQCLDALKAADVAIEDAHDVILKTLKALDQQRLGKPPVRATNDVRKANENWVELQKEYVKLAKQCRK